MEFYSCNTCHADVCMWWFLMHWHHSLWCSPRFRNHRCLTILSRMRPSLSLECLFWPNFPLPLNTVCGHPASFAISCLDLFALWRLSMMAFCTTVRSGVFSMILKLTWPDWDHLKAKENLWRCFALIIFNFSVFLPYSSQMKKMKAENCHFVCGELI